MSKFDLRAVGITAGVTRHRVAASATRTYVGEPLGVAASYTAGAVAAADNTVIQIADGGPLIATDEFRGICSQDFEVNSAGTVIAHYTEAISFIPYATKVRGKAKATANSDTQSELTGQLGDLVVFDLTSSAYRIDADNTGVAAGGLQIVDGNTTRGTLDCFVDARAMRTIVA